MISFAHMPRGKEGAPKPNPYETAVADFNTALQTQDFNVGEVRKAIDRVQNAGFETKQEPQSLFNTLSSLAEEAAAKSSTTDDQVHFANLAKGFTSAAESFGETPKKQKPAEKLPAMTSSKS